MKASELTVAALLDAVAEKTPTPGGGAVAAVTVALAASLAEMVINYSRGKPAFVGHAQHHAVAASQLHGFRTRALVLADEDAAAYKALNDMLRRKDNAVDIDRRDRVVIEAIHVPMEILLIAVRLAELLDRLCGTTNKFLDSDLAMAAILADAAAQSACWNVRINLPELSSEEQRHEFVSVMNSHVEAASGLSHSVLERLRAEAK